MLKFYNVLACLLMTQFYCGGQERTVGSLQVENGALDGYTLFSPTSDTYVYLINNYGQVVHKWATNENPGNAVYLMEDGTLYRAGQEVKYEYIFAGGAGGNISKFDWEGNLLWRFTYSSATYLAHHDFQVLPNGNVLILAWEVKNQTEVISNGRNPNLLSGDELWPEHIVEVEPVGTDQGNIVWEWHAWDHMVQDFDDTKLNYSVVSDHPEKIDINYLRPGQDGADWMHANSINYNVSLDQIILSVLNFDEIWIIDHNTTSEESSGEKGDLLFRWGNPQSYGKGTADDKKLFGQHNAHWIESGLIDEGKILIFNNGRDRPEGLFSSVVMINPIFEQGSYESDVDGMFLPNDFYWEYKQDPPTDMYSFFIAGAQQLSNGNMLVCLGSQGTFLEIDQSFDIKWKYVNPISNFGTTEQGQPVGVNSVFRATKFSASYTAFAGKNLTPGNTIENGPVLGLTENGGVTVYPNPTSEVLQVDSNGISGLELLMTNLQGKELERFNTDFEKNSIDMSGYSKGIYLLQVVNLNSGQTDIIKVIKN